MCLRSAGACTAEDFPAGVLFDLDGTLLDTASDMAGALNALLIEEGRAPLPFEQLRPSVSHGALALVRLGFGTLIEPELSQLRARFLDLYGRRLTRETRIYAGLPRALDHLDRAGIRWGIVTNKPGFLTEPLLEHLGLRARAQVVVSGDTLPQRKPHPAQLLHAAAQLELPPGKCLYIGDAERDVLAARAAGMHVWVALFGYIPAAERPLEWPAHGWLHTPRELAELLLSMRRDLDQPSASRSDSMSRADSAMKD